MLKRSGSIVVALVLALALSACNAKDAVGTGLIALQGAAIAANSQIGSNGQPALSDADTRKVVTYTTQALTVLSQTPNGWQATVKTSWTAFTTDLPAATSAKFSKEIAVISAAVAAL